MNKIKFVFLMLSFCSTISYGQNIKSKKTTPKKTTTPSKSETVKWILEKLNTYSLNDIIIKCGDGKLYNDKYSNFSATFNETTNEFSIQYKITALNDNSSLFWTRTFKATDFKDIKDYSDQPGTQGCNDRRLIAINTNCKCIKEASGYTADNQIKLSSKEDYVFLRFDSNSESDLLKRLTTAFSNLKSLIQNPSNQPY